jgi:hypothetical protein
MQSSIQLLRLFVESLFSLCFGVNSLRVSATQGYHEVHIDLRKLLCCTVTLQSPRGLHVQ